MKKINEVIIREAGLFGCRRNLSAGPIIKSPSLQDSIKFKNLSHVSTQVKKEFTVPISVADIHLRNEQLPFAYFFDGTFDPKQLEISFGEVLKHFPTAGGEVENYQRIRCTPEDYVPISFVDADMTMKEWLSVNRGHLHQSGNGHHPSLLPIFDPLFYSDLAGAKAQNNCNTLASLNNLLTARVTHFADNSGTAVSLNANHLLGDTASCVRLAECWGKAHQQRHFGTPCLNRAALSCTGMMNPKMVDLLHSELRGVDTEKEENASSWHRFFFGVPDMQKCEEKPNVDHEYISLAFPAKVLNAMKAHGMKNCRDFEDRNNDRITPSYVSKNDMIMALCWLIKRILSKDYDSHLSVVMNLRGRCGVRNFEDNNDEEGCGEDVTKMGLFGNGIVNVFAECESSSFDGYGIDIAHVSNASLAIRKSLIKGVEEIPRRLTESKLSRPSSSSTKPLGSNTSSFLSITSWRQLSPQNVSFSTSSSLVSFHGQPAHPLPAGKTYTSIVHSDLSQGGASVDMFLPSDQAQIAAKLHKDVCTLFLKWHELFDERM